MTPTPHTSRKPRLGINACLPGAEVRYNGGHKESHLCSQTQSEYLDFVSLCPEVTIGLGTPREPIRLVGAPDVYLAQQAYLLSHPENLSLRNAQ